MSKSVRERECEHEKNTFFCTISKMKPFENKICILGGVKSVCSTLQVITQDIRVQVYLLIQSPLRPAAPSRARNII